MTAKAIVQAGRWRPCASFRYPHNGSGSWLLKHNSSGSWLLKHDSRQRWIVVLNSRGSWPPVVHIQWRAPMSMPAAAHSAGLPLSCGCRCWPPRLTAHPVVISRACMPVQMWLVLSALCTGASSMMPGKMPWHVTERKSAGEVVTPLVLY